MDTHQISRQRLEEAAFFTQVPMSRPGLRQVQSQPNLSPSKTTLPATFHHVQSLKDDPESVLQQDETIDSGKPSNNGSVLKDPAGKDDLAEGVVDDEETQDDAEHDTITSLAGAKLLQQYRSVMLDTVRKRSSLVLQDIKETEDADQTSLLDKLDDEVDVFIPPDGRYGWVVAFGAFLSLFWCAGMVKSYGVIFNEMLHVFPDASKSLASWIPASMTSLALAMAPLASALCQRWNCRYVTLIGAAFCTMGIALSSLAPNIETLFFTLGILTGFGAGLSTTPGIILTARYFTSNRAKANAFCLSGTAFGSFVLPHLIQLLVIEFGFSGALLILGSCMLHLCVSAMLYRPLAVHVEIQKKQRLREAKEKQNVSFCENQDGHQKEHRDNQGLDAPPDQKSVSRLSSHSDFSLGSTYSGSGSRPELNTTPSYGLHMRKITPSHSHETNGQLEGHHQHSGFANSFVHHLGSAMSLFKSHRAPNENTKTGSKRSFVYSLEDLNTDSTSILKDSRHEMPIILHSAHAHHHPNQHHHHRKPVVRLDRSVSTAGRHTQFDPQRQLVRSMSERNHPQYQSPYYYHQHQHHHQTSAAPLTDLRPERPRYVSEGHDDEHPTSSFLDVLSIIPEPEEKPEDFLAVTIEVAPESEKAEMRDVDLPEKEEVTTCSGKVLGFLRRHFDIGLIREPIFLNIAATVMLMTFGVPHVLFFLPAQSEMVGGVDASTLLSVAAIFDLLGRLISGFIIDLKLLPLHVFYAGAIFSAGAAVMTIPLMSSVAGLWVATGLYGLGAGTWFLMVPLSLSEFLGVERIAASYGMARFFQSGANLFGPIIGGLLWDWTGNLNATFYFIGGVMALGSIIALLQPIALKRSSNKKGASDKKTSA